MNSLINEATAPWILGALGVLVLVTIFQIVAAWRQVKRSPYFFLRQRAERRLQTQSWIAVGLVVAAGITMFYAGQAPPDTTMRMALLAKAKPVTETAEVRVADLPVIDLETPQSVEFNPFSGSAGESTAISTTASLPVEGLNGRLDREPELPADFDQFEPEVEITPDTKLTRLVFSTEINDEYDPVSPTRTFFEGNYTIYATFDYEGMADGMEWAWIWRRDGEIVNGGNELWAYGDDGPGWIYYEPPEGFSSGQYTLEVWVNGELFQQASLVVEGEAANR